MRIRKLSPLIANQIAAGEVVERPASVVKELLENSFDAQATAVTIEIDYGGLNQIRISDNGIGIIAEDLPLAIAAHATSKINTLDDLYSIESMGFRGEALASIASVAKLTISSKPAHQETAMMLKVHSAQVSLSQCARTIGTTIDVTDLFFNAPVRKKFLKSEKIEFQAIEWVVKRFALSAPFIALSLKHNGKQVLSLPAATNEQAKMTRMSRILGNSFVKEAINIEVDHGAMKLSGWISGINFQRSQNDRLWVYINQRMVKDKLIYNALKQSYEGLLHPGRFPTCLLYLTINPAEVDVNVHPTKHEVRFQQPRLVFDFLMSQLSAALSKSPVQDDESSTPFDCSETFNINSNIKKISLNEPQSQSYLPTLFMGDTETQWIILNNRYSLIFIKQQPYVVDVVILQQLCLQEQLTQQAFPLANRPLLVPIRHFFPIACKNIELEKKLNQVGIHLIWLGEQEVHICSIPICMPYLNLQLFLETAADFKDLHQNTLIQIMINSQVFDPRLFSQEEKIILSEFLMRMKGEECVKPGVFKLLTFEECRNLLHV